jgi:anti-sigma factor (TIGR02949 family)
MSKIDRLSCEELFRRLDDYFDRELDAEESRLVREHLETCAFCAAEYAFEESVLRNVKEKLRRIKAPRDLMSKITRMIDEKTGGA